MGFLDVKVVSNVSEMLEKSLTVLSDFKGLFELLSSDFYKDEKRIFSLKGPGKYEDLSPAYKVAKRKRFGFVYPILFAKGRLAASLLSRTHRDSVNIINKTRMVLGTTVPYARFHHLGTSKMPKRPLWLDEDPARDKRWERTTEAWLKKSIS